MSNTDDTNTEDIIRPMHCELHALTRSDGSALLTQGIVSPFQYPSIL